MANTHGKPNVIKVLADDLAFPSATGANCTSMAYIGGNTDGKLMLSIYAGTNGLTVATGQAFSIELKGFTADTIGSADSFYSKDNEGGRQSGTGTILAEAHNYLIHKTSADAALAFTAGDLMWEQAVPDNMLRLISYDWIMIAIDTDEVLTGFNYDAFVWAKP